MAIKVVIGNEAEGPFRIEADAEGLLKLPSIHIDQLNKAQPAVWVLHVRAEIKGDDQGILLLGAAYANGAILRQFDAKKPYALVRPLECPPQALNLRGQKLSPGQYLLRVEVGYQQPPAFSGAEPGKKTAAFAERFLEVPSETSPCTLRAEWKHQQLIVGHTAAELRIEADHLPRSVGLTVSVSDPTNIVIPALRDALNQQFKATPPHLIGEHDPEGRSVFVQTIDFSFDDPQRQAVVRLASAAGALPVDLRIVAIKPAYPKVEVASTVLAKDKALRIDFQENLFPGYPILDLGTSSTFALIYYSQHQAGLLPVEQEQTFRGTLLSWFDRKDGVFGTPEWQQLIVDALKRLHGADKTSKYEPAAALKAFLRQKPPAPGHNDVAVQAVLRVLESSGLMQTFRPEIRLALRRELADMYTRAFRRFPLQQRRLLAVELDLNRAPDESPEGAGAMVEPIASTTEVVGCHSLALDIGPEADANRLQAGASTPAALLTQYHSSPKNYYPLLGQPGEFVTVSVGGETVKVTPREFLVAALKRLLERIDKYRQKTDKLPMKRFDKIVMPFPTSAPLSVRQEILVAAREAGFDRPIADLDEALSAVVFYLINPFGADLEMGLEAFRTNCRPVIRGEGAPPLEWMQNILLIDVGGGTTDIALVEVKLADMQAKGAGDGSRGRYYQLTPKLLGATGRPQLAGNLLSLGVFHGLKKRIADAVLSALDPSARSSSTDTLDGSSNTSEEMLNVRRLFEVAETVHPRFKDEKGARYRPGALLEHYLNNQLWREDGERLAPHAFALANQVLPTAWERATDDSSRSASARRFYALWQIAEEVKVKVFGKQGEGRQHEHSITQEQLGRLLGISSTTCEKLGIAGVSFGPDSFREAIDPPLTEIAQLALDLTNTRLRGEGDRTGPRNTSLLMLDRIILTGQTCRLPRVREIVTETFLAECERENSRLRWSPTALVFEGDYAKPAAALGAAYAQLLREVRVPPNVEDTLNGNVLDIDIQNLFFFLQSGFKLRRDDTSTGHEVLLTPGLPFLEFDAEGDGHIRSEWNIIPREMVYFDRFDFETGGDVPWGEFDCKLLADSIEMPFSEFQAEVRMAIETDHRLVVSLLFCRGNERHYMLPTTTKVLDIPAVLRDLKILPALTDSAPDADWLTPLAGWTLGINVQGGYGRALFRLAPDELQMTFAVATSPPEGSPDKNGLPSARCRGAVSEELPACPSNRIDKFYVRPANETRDWIQIGEMQRPSPKAGRRVSTRAILDESGHLRIHLGELPFLTAQQDSKLLEPGTVLRKALSSPDTRPDDLRNPFCGRH